MGRTACTEPQCLCKGELSRNLCAISDFRHCLNDILALLACTQLCPTFQDKLSFPSSRVKQEKRKETNNKLCAKYQNSTNLKVKLM